MLKLDARPAFALVTLAGGQQQVAQFAESRVRSQQLLLPVVEVDRPPAQRDGGWGASLCAHDAGRAAAGTHAGQALVDDDDAAGATRSREVRGPAADCSGADDHQVRGVAWHGPRSLAGAPVPGAPSSPGAEGVRDGGGRTRPEGRFSVACASRTRPTERI